MCVCVWQVFEFLIRLHSADSSDEEEVFPFIRTLLHFDTREFLNVLAMVSFHSALFNLTSKPPSLEFPRCEEQLSFLFLAADV